MSQISIDVRYEDTDTLVSEQTLAAVTTGCLSTLNLLGKIGKTIEMFKITFTTFPHGIKSDIPGPVFEIYVKDPLGRNCSFGIDFRFIGSGSPTPTSDEISNCLKEELAPFISKSLKSARGKLDVATIELDELESA